MQNESSERREFLRADINVILSEETSTSVQLARACDLSERGVRYLRPRGAPERGHSPVFIEFCLPGDERPVRAACRVVYDRSGERVLDTAVEFTGIESRDAERIRHYVVQRKRAELFESLRTQHLMN